MSSDPCFDPTCPVCHEDSVRVMGRLYRVMADRENPLSWPDDFEVVSPAPKPPTPGVPAQVKEDTTP